MEEMERHVEEDLRGRVPPFVDRESGAGAAKAAGGKARLGLSGKSAKSAENMSSQL